MTQSTKKLLTTVAFAALASTALPSLAQEAPATQEPAAPAASSAPVVVQQAQPAPPVSIAPAPVVQASPTVPTPPATVLKVPELDPPVATAAPAERVATRARAAAATPRATSEPAATTAARAVEPALTPAAPASRAPADELAAAPEAPAATAPTAQQATADQPAEADWSTIGGIAAVGGAAALGIGGLALSRRRRDPLADDAIATNAIVAEPVIQPANAYAEEVATPVAAPAMVTAAPAFARETPAFEGVGRHVAAARVGPTPENPFLTERARMRRARFLDKREEMELARNPMPVEATRPSVAARSSDELQTTYRFGKGKAGGLGSWLRPART